MVEEGRIIDKSIVARAPTWENAVPLAKPELLPTLKSMLEPLTTGQKHYLSLRLIGLSLQSAVKEMKKSGEDPAKYEGKKFIEVEQYVIDHQREYKKEALEAWLESLAADAIMIMTHLVALGENWEALPKDDKPYVFRAAMMVAKVQAEKPRSPDISPYERDVLERYS